MSYEEQLGSYGTDVMRERARHAPQSSEHTFSDYSGHLHHC